jgi:hypothetical protein
MEDIMWGDWDGIANWRTFLMIETEKERWCDDDMALEEALNMLDPQE